MAEEDTLQETGQQASEDAEAHTPEGAETAAPEDVEIHSEDADVEVEREEDAPTVAELDPETRARRDAALRKVRKFGAPVLRAAALPVDRFDDALKIEVERMGEAIEERR